MKALKLLALTVCVLLFSQCKSPTQATQGTQPTLGEVIRIWGQADTMYFRYADSTNGDTFRSLFLTMDWLRSQPNVASVNLTDSTHIDIIMKSGLETGFYINLIGPDSLSNTRGGGGYSLKTHANMLPSKPDLDDRNNEVFEASNPLLPATAIKSANTITNKKILFWIPPYEEFYGSHGYRLQSALDKIAKSGLGLAVTIHGDDNTDAVWTDIKDFMNYGLVIMDTHGINGRNNSFLTGDIINLTDVGPFIHNGQISEADLKRYTFDHDGARVGTYDNIIDGNFITQYGVDLHTYITSWQKSAHGIPEGESKLFVTARYLNTLPSWPNTIIFGNFCFSGETLTLAKYPEYQTTDLTGKVIVEPATTVQLNPIAPGFTNRNPISYYYWGFDNGNSNTVWGPNAILGEDSLVKAFVVNLDSTGHANLYADGTKIWDPRNSFPDARLNLQRFGADNYSYDQGCVSEFTDARDGQVYKAVCIGKQNWMAQNLNYALPGSECYDSLSSNCDIYGRLYRRSMVMAGAASSSANPSGVQGICPKGWHLPSAAEWDQLIEFLGGPTLAGGPLKSTSSLWYPSINKVATNSSGFSALPSGEWVDDNAAASVHDFFNLTVYAFYHTCTELYPNQVSVISLDYNSTNAKWATYPATTPPVFAGNVACRCVKDP